MSADKRAVLRCVRVFADLGDDECDALLRVLKARRGAAGDTLFREGERGDSLMIVLEGQLVARVRTATGVEEEVARLGPGEVVGEMAFLDAEPRSASVSTVAGATVLDFTRDALGALKRDAPRVAAAILKNVLSDVARRLREAGEKLSDGASRTSMPGGAETKRPLRGLTASQLRTIPALASYGDEDLELLAYVSTLRSFSRGAVLAKEGAEGDACWLVVSGSVAVTRSGSATTLATLGPGALVGQLALLDRAPRSATLSAAEDTMTLEVPASAFANLVRAHTAIALRFQEQIALAGVRQLRAATKMLAESSGRMQAEPNSMRMIDDWDEGGDAPPLELAIDPAAGRR